MIGDKVVDLGVEICENLRRSGDESGLVAVAAGEVLRGYDADRVASLGPHQQYLAVIVSKIGALDNLGDKRPQFERLVGRLVVEHQVYAAYMLVFGDKEQAPQKFLRY